MDAAWGTDLDDLKMMKRSSKPSNRLWLGLLHHLLYGIEHNIHRQVVLLRIPLRQRSIGFSDTDYLQVSTLMCIEHPANMSVMKTSNPDSHRFLLGKANRLTEQKHYKSDGEIFHRGI